jgi:hypothetical protein
MSLQQPPPSVDIEVIVYDYDFGPDPDDLLGRASITGIGELVAVPNVPREFNLQLLYKAKPRGSVACVLQYSTAAGKEQLRNEP